MKLNPSTTSSNFANGNIYEIYNLNSKKYIFISNFSSIYQYEIETLKLIKKSPLLYFTSSIENILTFKNRTFATIGSTLHVLDFLVPTTRIKLFNKGISNMLRNKDKLFLFSDIEQKGYLIEAWNLRSIKKFKPKDKITLISETNFLKKNNFFFFYSNEGKIEMRDVDSLKSVYSFSIGLYFDKNNFFLSCIGENLFISFKKGFLYISNLNNEIKTRCYKNKKFTKFTKFIPIDGEADMFFFEQKKNLFVKKKKKVKKVFLEGQVGRLKFIELIKENLFLTMGKYDNALAIYVLDKKKMNFRLLKKRSGEIFPLRRSCNLKFNKNLINIESKFIEILRQKNDKIKIKRGSADITKIIYNKKKTTKKFLNSENKKVELKEIIVKKDPLNPLKFKLVIFFFRNPRLWLIDINLYENSIKIDKPIQNEKNIYNISCLCVNNNFEIIVIGYEDNFISFFSIKKKKFLFHRKNHNFFDCKYRCKIKFLEFDTLEIFCLSYCTHGILNLWDLFTLKIQKTLIIKGLDLLKWSKIRDLICTSTLNWKIYLIIPQSFHKVRILSGHFGKIQDFLFFKKDRYLISSSSDKTIRIWDLLESKYCDKIKFKYAPNTLIKKEEKNTLYISHENTIELGKWNISCIKPKILKNEEKFSFSKNLENKEMNFTFSWDQLASPLKIFSSNNLIENENDIFRNRIRFSNSNSIKTLRFKYLIFFSKNVKKLFTTIINFAGTLDYEKSIEGAGINNEKFLSGEFLILFAILLEEIIEICTNRITKPKFLSSLLNLHFLGTIFNFILSKSFIQSKSILLINLF